MPSKSPISSRRRIAKRAHRACRSTGTASTGHSMNMMGRSGTGVKNIQMDLTGYAFSVHHGTESLTVEWSSGDHSSGGALPPQAPAVTVAVERNRQRVAWTTPNLMCRSQ